jgi:hypothetical protein
MAIDHERHRITIKAVSDRMLHPITYNDAGAPRSDGEKRVMQDHMDRENMREDMRRSRRDARFRDMITGGR